MIERVALKLFFVCMPICAGIFLSVIWFGDPDGDLPEWIFKIAATAFIIGLASFLVWFTHIAYRLLAAYKEKEGGD